MTWRSAFFAQARADWRLFCELKQRTDVPMCQKLHYLQMATEKLAKAFSSSQTGQRPPRSHVALTRFLKVSKGRPEIRHRLGYQENYRSFCAYIDSLLGIAQQIEQLAPVGDQEGPNAEYPWLDPDSGDVVSPAEYAFPEFSRQELLEFQHFTNTLFRILPHM